MLTLRAHFWIERCIFSSSHSVSSKKKKLILSPVTMSRIHFLSVAQICRVQLWSLRFMLLWTICETVAKGLFEGWKHIRLSVFVPSFDLWTPVCVCVQEAVDRLKPEGQEERNTITCQSQSKTTGGTLRSYYGWFCRGFAHLVGSSVREKPPTMLTTFLLFSKPP